MSFDLTWINVCFSCHLSSISPTVFESAMAAFDTTGAAVLNTDSFPKRQIFPHQQMLFEMPPKTCDLMNFVPQMSVIDRQTKETRLGLLGVV